MTTLETAKPAKSFIESYMEYAANLTDAPEIYHKFLGLNLLSLAVGRTPISITPKELYPNAWVILIGLSGVTRKSSAMNLALSVLPDDNKSLPNEFSPEALQQALSEQSQGLIWKEEIGGFLESIKKRDYMGGMADLLCQLFDCPETFNRRLRKEDFKLNDVCFNIIAATTPSRFLDTVQSSDFNSGFQSRFLIVVGVKTKSAKRRKWLAEDTERLDRCKAKWQEIFEIFHTESLNFELDEKAMTLFNSWCDGKDAEILGYADVREADMKSAIASRMEDYIVKLSALYEVDKVSKTGVSKLVKDSISISKESVEKACSDIDNLLTQLTDNLLTSLTEDKVSTKLVKLTNTIKKKAEFDGWTQHRVLLQHMNCSADALRILLTTAFQIELIEVKTEGKATYYRVKTAEKVEEKKTPQVETMTTQIAIPIEVQV